jgi:DNA-binding response OmpR family regulator
LEAARRTTPDLILCDIMMPEMDGKDLCRAVRSDLELAYLPVTMVTPKASRQSRLSALEGGADDYLVKPFDPEELRLRVGKRRRTPGMQMMFSAQVTGYVAFMVCSLSFPVVDSRRGTIGSPPTGGRVNHRPACRRVRAARAADPGTCGRT